MKIVYAAAISAFLLLVIFPASSRSQMNQTTTCNVLVENKESVAKLRGTATMHEDQKNVSIVIKWENGNELTFNGPKTGYGTSGRWVNNLGNSGTMLLSKKTLNSYEGYFVFNKITSMIYVDNCTAGGNQGGNRTIADVGVFFHNTGTTPLTVMVSETDGPRPPDPSQSTVVFPGPPTSTTNSAAGLSLAYGCYSFCVYWDTGKTDSLNQIIYSYRFIGKVPGDPAICLNENTPLNPTVLVSSGTPAGTGVGYEGQCPGARQAGQGNNTYYPPQQPQGQQNPSSPSMSDLPSCNCTNPRNGKRFLKPSLIAGACDDPTVLDYLTPQDYNCR